MQSPHQVDMKNIVEDFFAYFNALETHAEVKIMWITDGSSSFRMKDSWILGQSTHYAANFK